MQPLLLLAAGLGTRLDPLTRLVAKPAVPLGGLTLVQHILDRLHRHGIRDVVINLHHRAETITAAVGDGAGLGMRVRYSWEDPVLGSAGGPRHALPLLHADTFFIVNGDTLTDVALAPLLGAHRRTGAAVTLAVIPNPAPDRYSGLLLDDEHAVLGVVPRGRATGSWHFVGVQVANADVFADLPDGEPAETIAGIYRDMPARAAGELRALPVQTEFLDVGTPADYLDVALRLAGQPEGAAIEPGADVDPAAILTHVSVWPGATVAAGATLHNCIVAGNAQVPRGFRASDAVLVPESVVRADDDVDVRDGVAVFAFNRP